MRSLLPLVILIAGSWLPARGDERATLPKTDPPVFGTAIVSDVGKELAFDEYGLLWELTIKIPKVYRQAKIDRDDFKLPPKLRGSEEEVQTKLTEYRLRHIPLDQHVQPLVADLAGKVLSREQVLQRLNRETPVLVSLRPEHPDAYYLQLVKPDTLVVIFGPWDRFVGKSRRKDGEKRQEIKGPKAEPADARERRSQGVSNGQSNVAAP